MRRTVVSAVLAMSLLLSVSLVCTAQENVIKLPAPQTDGGKPLMQALKLRQSTRDYGTGDKLSLQTLSNLLWAADGVNRPNGHRTAPSAVDWQNIDIYITTPDGLFLYEPKEHVLKVLSKEDVRASAGMQPFVKSVPLNLIYVSDFDRARNLGGGGPIMGTAETWSFAGTGAIAQNVYLFCASEGLASVMRAMFDKDVLGKVLKLRPDQHIILTQSVGYFKK